MDDLIRAAKLIMRICKPCLHSSDNQMTISFQEDYYLEPIHGFADHSWSLPMFNPKTLIIRMTCDHNYGIRTMVIPLW